MAIGKNYAFERNQRAKAKAAKRAAKREGKTAAKAGLTQESDERDPSHHSDPAVERVDDDGGSAQGV